MSKIHLWVSTYNISLFVSGLPYSIQCFLDLPICLQISRFHFFLLWGTPLCKCTTFSLSILQLRNNLGYFQVLAMTNNIAMNIVEHMSLWYNWASFGCIPKGYICLFLIFKSLFFNNFVEFWSCSPPLKSWPDFVWSIFLTWIRPYVISPTLGS